MMKYWLSLITLCYFIATYCIANGYDPYLRGVYIGTGETSQILDQILQNYDPYVRPATLGGGPIEMEVWMRIIELMLRDDDFYFKANFHRRWVDNRLKFEPKPGGREDITLDAGEFHRLIWQPDMVFLTHYSHNVMGRGLITIYSNGTVHHKYLDTGVVYVEKSAKYDQKSFEAELMGIDFGNDKNDLTYRCSPSGCLWKQDDDDKSKLIVESSNFSSTIKTILDNEYEVPSIRLRLTRRI